MTNALPSVEKTRNPASRPILPPYSWVTQPLSVSETAFVVLLTVPVNGPHPEIALGVGAGVSEIPQPPDSRLPFLVPLGFLLVIPVAPSHATPKKLTVVKSLPVSVTVKVPRSRLHLGVGPEPTVGAVAGSMPSSLVTKKSVTVLSPLPETVGEVSSEQEQLPELQA